MKKAFLTILILIVCICTTYADTLFRMSDGTRINGKIISVNDNNYIIESEDGSIITIHKSDIKRIKGKTTPDFRMNYPLKNNVDYHAYKRDFKIGLGFFIPGIIITSIPTLFCTGIVIQNLITYDTHERQSDVIAGVSCYFLSIGIGVILDLISIPFFISADKHYRRAIEQCKVSFDAGFSQESLKVAMNVSF